MVSLTPEQEYVNGIRIAMKDIIIPKSEDIIPRSEYENVVNYQVFINNYKRTQILFSEMYECDLENMHPEFLDFVKTWTFELLNLTKEITAFKILNFNSPKTTTQQYLDRLLNIYKNIWEKFRIEIAYSNSSLHNFNTKNQELDKRIQEIDGYRGDFVKESDRILKDLRTAAADNAVSNFADNFLKQAKQHQKASSNWLIAGLAFIISSFGVGFIFFDRTIKLPDNATNSMIIQNSITKLFIISAVISGIALCFKNYKANRHNYIINTHKVNSLNTFRLFVDSTEDPTIRNAIITQAATSVFSIPSTGYISTEAENDSSNKIIEVIKNITNSKS